MQTAQTAESTPDEVTEVTGLDSLDAAEAEAVALSEALPVVGVEVDLDDQTSTMGDSVHTYLKSIGRTSLLTAEQEVNLAKRIEAGLFAEHKLGTEPDLPADYRRDLGLVAEDGR
ncbi:MAG TPA: RNA polymerase sigma factor, partial [Actinobacteria bacterium]|nr:RNA polymerase sigma factor [Actinomycetota bacterium]